VRGEFVPKRKIKWQTARYSRQATHMQHHQSSNTTPGMREHSPGEQSIFRSQASYGMELNKVSGCRATVNWPKRDGLPEVQGVLEDVAVQRVPSWMT